MTKLSNASSRTKWLHTIHNLKLEHINAEIIGFAKHLLLDLIGVAAGANRLNMSRSIRDHAYDHFATRLKSSSRIMFDGRHCSPVGATMANAFTIDALDGHDGHPLVKGHVGCGLLPGLLAMVESTENYDSNTFLASFVCGYESGTRFGLALHSTACDYHTSGAWVALACAANGARYLRLNEEQTRHAIGIAEYHGPRSQMMRCIDYPTMLKDGSGWGAMAGVSAAYMAASGFTGAPAVTFEGDDVFEVWQDFGTHWRILEQYVKPYPVCRWAHSAMQAADEVKTQHHIDAADITAIKVATFNAGVRLNLREPKDTEQAQYSLPFPTAAILVNGYVSWKEVSEQALSNPEVLRLSNLIELVEDEQMESQFPSKRLAQVTLQTNDGNIFHSRTLEAKGTSHEPLSSEEIVTKYYENSVESIGEKRAQTIYDLVMRLDNNENLRELINAIMAGVDC